MCLELDDVDVATDVVLHALSPPSSDGFPHETSVATRAAGDWPVTALPPLGLILLTIVLFTGPSADVPHASVREEPDERVLVSLAR